MNVLRPQMLDTFTESDAFQSCAKLKVQVTKPLRGPKGRNFG